MVRTNVVIDQELVGKVMSAFGLGTKRSAIDFALRAVLTGGADEASNPWKAALELEGTWADRSDDELREIYGDELPDSDDDLGRT
jgi:Arc/MetJ family transcription regulator